MTIRKTKIAIRNYDFAKSNVVVRLFRKGWHVSSAFILVLSGIIGGGCAITPRIGFFSDTKPLDFASYQGNGVAETGRYDDWDWLSDELPVTSSSLSLRGAPLVVASADPHQSSALEERIDLVIGRAGDLGDLSPLIYVDDQSFALTLAGNRSSRRVANRLPNGILALSSVARTTRDGG